MCQPTFSTVDCPTPADALPLAGRERACVVETEGLTVVRGRTPVLRGIDVAVKAGESIAVMGPNGAGKTTLLACLAGALRPAAGAIRWFGHAAPRASAARRRIGYVGHESGLYAELTGLENLLFAARMHGLDDVHDRAKTLLWSAGLARHAHVTARRLSQGMRRRLAIARALVHEPPLVLLDEPFASLDPQSRAWLESLFAEFRELGRTIVFASHDEAQSRVLADRLVWMEAGSVATIEPIVRAAGRPPTYESRSA